MDIAAQILHWLVPYMYGQFIGNTWVFVTELETGAVKTNRVILLQLEVQGYLQEEGNI
jgi:hypothetical protein